MNYEILYNNSFAIILVLLVFTIIVFFHELGHYIAAKLFWVKVEEFWIWIPPKILNLFEDKSGTVYSLNLLPIWWFVSLKWEKMDDIQYYEKDSLVWKSIIKQIIIVLAWVFMNFVLAISIFSFLFYYWVQPLAINTKFDTTIKTKLIPTLDDAIKDWILKTNWISVSPIKDSIAEKAGLKNWDIVISINNVLIKKPEEMVNLIKYSTAPLNVQITRKNEIQNITVEAKGWKIWSYIWYNITEKNKDFQYKSPTIGNAIRDWYEESYNQTRMILELLGTTFKKLVFPKNEYERTEATESIGWPISVGSMFVDLVNQKAWIIVFVVIAALLSLNLWVFNLLPLPALDWWRFFILTINWIISLIFWKKVINEKFEKKIHIIWFSLLIWLSILVAYLDIFKIFHK